MINTIVKEERASRMRTYAVPTAYYLERNIQGEKMGRPLNKRYFGRLANTNDPRFAPLNDSEFNLTAIVKVGSNAVSESGIFLSQRSETKFKVNDTVDGTAVNTNGTAVDGSAGTGNVGFCTLVDKDVPDDNEMIVKGYVSGEGDGVNIRKFHNRTVFDFNNNRYTWEVQDDSTQTLLVLTAI